MKGKMCWTCIIYSCDPPKQKALWGWFSHYMVKRCKSLSERNQCTFFWISDSFNKQDGSHARPWRALWRFLTRLYWWWSSLHSEEMQIQSETESDSQKAFIINKWPYRWRVAHETQKNYLLLKLKPNKKKMRIRRDCWKCKTFPEITDLMFSKSQDALTFWFKASWVWLKGEFFTLQQNFCDWLNIYLVSDSQ